MVLRETFTLCDWHVISMVLKMSMLVVKARRAKAGVLRPLSRDWTKPWCTRSGVPRPLSMLDPAGTDLF